MKIIFHAIHIFFIILFIFSCERMNGPVEILSLNASDSLVEVGGLLSLKCVAQDEDKDPLAYSWESSSGSFSVIKDSAVWTAPMEYGIYFISCRVTDNYGASDVATVTIIVGPSNSVHVSGKVTNAVNRNPIPEVAITISDLSAVTDENGIYIIQYVPEGDHETSGSVNEFCSFTGHFTLPGNFPHHPGEIRFVLNWGAKPQDLDSHLLTPEIEGSSHHIYYSNPGRATNAPYAILDTDDVDGYGPETITIKQAFEGIYVYYIYKYSGDSKLTSSEAQINIYDNPDCNATTISIPSEGSGRYWYVCDIDGSTGNLTIINQIQESKPSR
jgi:hypothetical protein